MRILSLHENKITVVLSGDRYQTFSFNNRAEILEALRLWITTPDAEKPSQA